MTPADWFTNSETLIAKVQELYFRIQAHPGDPEITQEIQAFNITCALAWKPMVEKLSSIVEEQTAVIQTQTARVTSLASSLIDMMELVEGLTTCLQRFQAFRTYPNETLSLVPRTGGTP